MNDHYGQCPTDSDEDARCVCREIHEDEQADIAHDRDKERD